MGIRNEKIDNKKYAESSSRKKSSISLSESLFGPIKHTGCVMFAKINSDMEYIRRILGA